MSRQELKRQADRSKAAAIWLALATVVLSVGLVFACANLVELGNKADKYHLILEKSCERDIHYSDYCKQGLEIMEHMSDEDIEKATTMIRLHGA